ncbi:MAG: thioredoxin domain-containing protein [Micromonosporaceae bacterium]|nr:thioredoxin domain-containing protein [Micromonosporaceae bacterium]
MGTYVNRRYTGRPWHRKPAPLPEPGQERLRRSPVTWTIVGTLVALAAVAGLGWYLVQPPPPPPYATPAAVVDDGGAQAGFAVGGSGPVVVEVYQDFLSRDSRAVDAAIHPVLDGLVAANRIRLVWHPVGEGFNPTEGATRAANAVTCAADVGKLRAFTDALYANQPRPGQPGLSDDELLDIAGPAGLNMPAFAACVRDQRYRDWIGVVDARAAERGVTQVPAVYVNGTRLARPTPGALVAAIG